MSFSQQPYDHHEDEIRLPLDARKRISLAKLLPEDKICSVRAYKEGGKIILEPMAEISAHELWLYENPEAYRSLQRGLDQAEEGNVKKPNTDFSKWIDEEI